MRFVGQRNDSVVKLLRPRVSSFVVLLRVVVLLNDDKHNTKICSETH